MAVKRGDINAALEAWDNTIKAEDAPEKKSEEVVEEVETAGDTHEETTKTTPEKAVEKEPETTEEGQSTEEEGSEVAEEPERVAEEAAETTEEAKVIKRQIKWRGAKLDLELSEDEEKELLQKGYDYKNLMESQDQVVAKRVDETLSQWSKTHGLTREDPETRQPVTSAEGFIRFAHQFGGGQEAVLKAVGDLYGMQIPGINTPLEDVYTEEEKALDPSDPDDSRRLAEINNYRNLQRELSEMKSQMQRGFKPIEEMGRKSQEAQLAERNAALARHLDTEIGKHDPLKGLKKWEKEAIGWQAVEEVQTARAQGRTTTTEEAVTRAVQQAANDRRSQRVGVGKDVVKVVNENRPKAKTTPPKVGGSRGADTSKQELAQKRYRMRGTPAGSKDAMAAFEALEQRSG